MRWRRQPQPVVPTELTHRIDEAEAVVEAARAELVRVVTDQAPLVARRAAHADLRHAFDTADALLRQATAIARQHSYAEWRPWRHRLSTLGTARQVYLLAERDDRSLLRICSVQAIDTGMSGPDIGELQHGESRPSGTAPAYGLDLEALLTAPPEPSGPRGASSPVDDSRRQGALAALPPTVSAPEAA